MHFVFLSKKNATKAPKHKMPPKKFESNSLKPDVMGKLTIAGAYHTIHNNLNPGLLDKVYEFYFLQ